MIKSIIWLRLDSIGDAVLSSSMLPYVKKKFGEAKITVVCQKYICELYELCPVVDSIIASPSEYGSNWKSETRRREVLEKIKAKNPDILLNSVYSIHCLSDIKGLEFIPKRYAVKNHGKTEYTNFTPIRTESKNELDYHCDFLRGLGIEVSSLQPQIWIGEGDMQKARSLLQGVDLNKLIVLAAGARIYSEYCDKYGEALRGICRDLGYCIVAVGSGRHHNTNQKHLNVACPNGRNLSGKTTLRESAAIIKLAKLAVGGDSGPNHIACAVGTPNVVVLGNSYGYRFFPYSNLTSIVNVLNKDGSIRNVKSIPPDKIAKAVEKALNS